MSELISYIFDIVSKDVLALVIGPILILSSLIVIILILTRLIGRRFSSGFIRERYESGNIPYGEARKSIEMQYVAYLVLFATIEPILVIVTLLSLASNVKLALAFITGIIILTSPVLIYSVREAKLISMGVVKRDIRG